MACLLCKMYDPFDEAECNLYTCFGIRHYMSFFFKDDAARNTIVGVIVLLMLFYGHTMFSW